jgi:hypothetical protein
MLDVLLCWHSFFIADLHLAQGRLVHHAWLFSFRTGDLSSVTTGSLLYSLKRADHSRMIRLDTTCTLQAVELALSIVYECGKPEPGAHVIGLLLNQTRQGRARGLSPACPRSSNGLFQSRKRHRSASNLEKRHQVL